MQYLPTDCEMILNELAPAMATRGLWQPVADVAHRPLDISRE